MATIVVASTNPDGLPLPSPVLNDIEQRTDWVNVVLNGQVQFSGTPADLAASSIDDVDGLAGENPLEGALRLLLGQRIDGSGR